MRRLLLIALMLLPLGAFAQDLRYPYRNSELPYGGNGQNFVLDSSDDTLAYIINNPESHSFNGIVVIVDGRTGTQPTWKVGVQTVTSTGTCSGTYLTGTAGAECSGTFQPSANSIAQVVNTTATTGCTLPVGQSCILISYSSGTIGGSNNAAFLRTISNGSEAYLDKYEYTLRVSNGGAATRGAETPTVGTTDGTRYWGHLMKSYAYNDYSIDSGTADEYGNTWKEPCTGTFKYAGCQIVVSQGPAAGKLIKCALYSGTTEIDSCTIDTDNLGDGFGGNYTCKFSSLPTLNCNTSYVIAAQPQNTGTNWRNIYVTYENNAMMDSASYGKDCYKVARIDTGAWTTTTYNMQRMGVVPLLDRYISSGAGGAAKPMNSGMQP